MKVKLYKAALKRATSDRKESAVYFPWDWPELQTLDRIWPDDSPIEVEVMTDDEKRPSVEQTQRISAISGPRWARGLL